MTTSREDVLRQMGHDTDRIERALARLHPRAGWNALMQAASCKEVSEALLSLRTGIMTLANKAQP